MLPEIIGQPNSVNIIKLFNCMIKYWRQKIAARIEEKYCEIVEIHRGMRQGYLSKPLLFNLHSGNMFRSMFDKTHSAECDTS